MSDYNICIPLDVCIIPGVRAVDPWVDEMFEDMLFEAQKDAAAIGNHGVMEELAVEVREIVHRMEGAIPIAVVEEDENLEKYLSINDELHAALKKYDELLAENQSTIDGTHAKIRNMNSDAGLCNGTRLRVVSLRERSIEDNQDSNDDDPFADFIRARSGSKKETKEHVKHSAVENSKPEVERKVNHNNKAQGQSIHHVGIYLESPVFAHGQLYVALAEKETTPAPLAQTKDLIDLWDGNNSFSKAAATVSSLQGPSSTTSSTFDTSSSDPFDVLDFSTKASTSAHTAENPFHSLQIPPSQPQQCTHPASFNPFDF
ncbi:Helitron helicase-like protein [Phytophthora palmivora]|uniref:Helitron helicase-like protein n=1 Tax=Phytophthora palmivora TaxID=4796 RepID=A0A2P4YRI9_9STRA|nr:Helitron helicase-like protein [Phytophthora palmivora]